MLLALAGDVRGANALWNTLEVHGGSKSRAAMLEFAELYFDSALAGFRAGRYAPARLMARTLECARPYIEEHGSSLTATTSFEGGEPRMTQERSTEFLAALPALAEELRRRATAPRTALEPSQLATASAASLINELDTVELRWAEYGNPFEREPLLRALRARGAAVVPELIDAFERDARWTRTIEHESYPLHRHVETVRGLLAWLINETTGIYASEFGWRSFSDGRDASSQDVAVALRNRWRAIGELAPFARAISTLEDTSANFTRQIFGVAWLFRPADGQPSVGALVRGAGPRVIDRFAIEGPSLTNAQREQLVRALRLRAPAIGPLRDQSPVVLAEEDRRCAYSQMLFLVSPTDAAPFVRETLERTYARNPDQLSPGCSAWLAGALVATGDRGAADEVARRIRSLRAADTELRSAAGWWYALANRAEAQPIWDAIARDVGDVREWPVQTAADRRESFVAPGTLSVVSKPLLRVRVLREVLLRLLDDARTNAMIQVQGDSNEAQYLNPRGVRALTFERSAEGPDFVARGTTERLRLADGVADFLAREGALEPAIEFDLRWTRARRDVAISAIKDQLRSMP